MYLKKYELLFTSEENTKIKYVYTHESQFRSFLERVELKIFQVIFNNNKKTNKVLT